MTATGASVRRTNASARAREVRKRRKSIVSRSLSGIPVAKTKKQSLPVWVVVGSATVADVTLSVGKADANASPILPTNVADKLGLFKKHGLDVKISDFTGGSKVSQAMVAGSIDIGVGAGTEMAFVSKGAPIIAVCDDAPPIPFIGIAVPWDSPVHSVDQLKGRKIGVRWQWSGKGVV